MSSRHQVFIRILALLQRKTLIETKNRTLKCLKRHYSTVRSIKNVAVLTEDGAFALFFRPHPGGIDSSRVPTPRNLPSKAKKMLTLEGQPRGRGGGSTAGIDWCIMWVMSPWLSSFYFVWTYGLITSDLDSTCVRSRSISDLDLLFLRKHWFFFWLWAFHLSFNNQPTSTHMAITLMSCFDVTVNTKKMSLSPQCAGKMY